MTDEAMMLAALEQARLAAAEGEVPVGCVIWHEGSSRLIARAYNRRERDHDPTAHAELLALRDAARRLGDWRLEHCTLAVTLEPCPMCAGAIVNARVQRVVYGCDDPKAGAARSLFSLLDDPRLNHRCEVVAGVLAEPAATLLRGFFRERRR